ncbi:MAG: hypothetical protein ABI867_36740 [Kofleriaceae bacterium]
MSRIPQPLRDAPAAEWNVYADALQEANDPRGVLIALAEKPAERDAHVAQHKQALFGPAAEYFDAFQVGWKYSLPDSVEIAVKGDTAAALVEAFLQSPLAEGVREVVLAGVASKGFPVDLTAGVKRLLAKLPDTVRSLGFVDQRASQTTMLASRDFDPGDNLVTFGSLADIWKVTDLEEVRIEVADVHQLDVGTIDAPALRSFTLRSLRYGANDAPPITAALAAARWPALRSFELRLPEEFCANLIADEDAYIPWYAGNEDYEDRMDEAEIEGENMDGTNWAQLAPVLANLAKCPLERLALTSFDSAETLLATLAEAGWAPSLVELDLSDSSIRDAAWFEANQVRLATVKRLVLERVALTEADAKRLEKLGPELRYSSGSGASYRYIVGSE